MSRTALLREASYESELLLAFLALDLQMITRPQLDRCLLADSLARGDGEASSIPQLLLDWRWLDEEAIESLHDLQRTEGRKRLVPGYRVDELLGCGATALVFKAWQFSMERHVALKLLPEIAQHFGSLDRFLRETRAAARLQHPNIVTGIDCGEVRGLYYFVMEFIEGESLKSMLLQRGRLAEREALRIALETARALEHAHALGMVHRDVKPGNIMISRCGAVKLLDLGLIKPPAAEDPQMTLPGTVLGTPAYMSPEQARADEQVDIRSDIYGLGVCLHQMLTGELPADATTTTRQTAQQRAACRFDPRSIVPELSESVATTVERMTRFEPAERFQTPAELIAALEQASASPTGNGEVIAAGPALEPGRYTFFKIPGEHETAFTQIALKSGLLSSEQVLQALRIQETRAELGIHDSLDAVYRAKGWISEEQAARIHWTQTTHRLLERSRLFGKLAVRHRLASAAQVKSALLRQRKLLEARQRRELHELLGEDGVLDPLQRRALLARQAHIEQIPLDREFGRAARRCGLLGRQALERALELQALELSSRRLLPLAEVLVALGLLDPQDIAALQRALRRHAMTGWPLTALVDEVRRAPAGDAAQHSESDSGLFTTVALKDASAVECPLCHTMVPLGRRRCPDCDSPMDPDGLGSGLWKLR